MNSFPPRLAHPSGIDLELERDRVVVMVEDGPAASANNPLDELNLVPEADARPFTANVEESTRAVNDGPGRTWARTADGAAFAPAAATAAQPTGVSGVGPVYVGDLDGERIEVGVRPDVLLITPAANSDATAKALDALGVTVDESRSEYLGGELWCRINDALSSSCMDLANEVANLEEVASVRLEMMPMYRPQCYVPNDGLFNDQWNITQIKAGGNNHTGWNDQRGDAAIVIAVLDDGVELKHQDLRIAANGINLGTMAGTGQALGNDRHGTACAGCAAAKIDNNEGAAGVAGGCSILPIAFDAWSDTEVAAGIRYAARNGANVLSMSFGWDAWDRRVINPAIQEAYDRNVVMCAATHNHNRRGITYPAIHPLVMACGASDQTDERKSPSSPDGEDWGSNFGRQMSVVAPGVRIPTTDRLGTRGYDDGDYTMTFRGTSAATPQVAGLAALILSCDPSLSAKRVRQLIEQNADKVGATPYRTIRGNPNGTWNNRMGYGRINVERTIHELCGPPTVKVFDPPDFEVPWWRFVVRVFDRLDILDELDNLTVSEDFPGIDLDDPIDRVNGTGRLLIDTVDRVGAGNGSGRSVHRRG